MTGLNDKTAALIDLLTATNTKLDAVADLLTALAPPSPPDFSDLLAAMQGVHDDTSLIAASASLIQGNTYDTIGAISDTRGALLTLTSYIGHDAAAPTGTTINTILQDMRRNNLNQMQGVIQAVILAACPCAETPLYLPPPPTTTPFPGTDSDKCKRVQKVIAVFTAYLDNVANISSIGAGLTQPGLAAAITLACTEGGIVGAEAGLLAGPPGAVVGALIGALSLALAAIGSALMSTLSIQWLTAPLISQIEEALFNAANAADGSDAFQNIVNTSDVVSWYWVPVINYMWWSAWADLIYDETIELDLTGFDGTLCGQTIVEDPCVDYISDVQINEYGFTYVHITTDTPFLGDTHRVAGDFYGWTFELTAVNDFNPSYPTVTFDWFRADNSYPAHPHQFSALHDTYTHTEEHTAAIAFYMVANSGASSFTVRGCPPA
jgi:hypothetical protein